MQQEVSRRLIWRFIRTALSIGSQLEAIGMTPTGGTISQYINNAGSQRELDDLIAEPWWGRLRAVTSHRAYAVSRAELLIPGPRTIDGVEHLAAIFHPMAPTQ